MNYVKIFLICLLISGCAPLRIEIRHIQKIQEIKETSEMDNFLECLSSEPIWNGQTLGIETLKKITRGHTYETIDEFKEYFKKTNPNIREDLIDDWIERVKERYERLEK